MALSGDASDLKTIFDENITKHTGAVTVTDGAYNVSELLSIANGKTSGTITLDDNTVALSGDATDLTTIFSETFAATHNGGVTITDGAYNLSELKSVNAGTRGEITLSDRTVALSGDATDLALALAGTINHNGAVTVTDGGYNVSELAAIALSLIHI